MLSPGEHYKQVPRELIANLRYRDEVLRACNKSPADRRRFKDACRDDLLFYLNTFAWTFRPKVPGNNPKVYPFVSWDFQDGCFRTVLDHIDRQRDLVAEKSRDMGWSWICLYVADWHWRFHDYVKISLFSRVGDLVDSRDPDALFWKLRFIQKWLPEWLWPDGWSARKHDTDKNLQNPENGSTITGAATTQDMGVAGRSTWCVFDEFSRVPNARSVRDNTKDTSDCRVFVSTHTGPGTCFHDLCTNGVTDKIVTHWTQHPARRRGLYRTHPELPVGRKVEFLDPGFDYDPEYRYVVDGTPSGGPLPGVRSIWYDRQAEERSKVDLKTNCDIDVAGSTSQFFDPGLIRRLKDETGRDPVWVGDVLLGDEPKLVALDTGPLKLWVRPDHDGLIKLWRNLMGSDIAAGTGATPSCLTVLDAVRHEKVAEYTNAHITPERFAHVAQAIGFLFRDPSGMHARFAWDASGAVGKAFTKELLRLGYPNVYYRKSQIGYAGYEKDTDQPGWYGGNPEAKAALLLEYAGALERRTFVNPSKAALEECLMFRWSDGQVEHSQQRNPEDDSAARLNHADHVIADALACLLDGYKGAGPEAPEPDEPLPLTSWQGRRFWGNRADRAGDDDWQ